jgi:hypothetical protein
MKLFWVDKGEEVEVRAGSLVAGDIKMRFEEREKRFVLGERVAVSVDEFAEAMFTA